MPINKHPNQHSKMLNGKPQPPPLPHLRQSPPRSFIPSLSSPQVTSHSSNHLPGSVTGSDSDSSLIMSLNMSKTTLDKPHTDHTPETFQKLEVESISTTSNPISFPYALIFDNSNFQNNNSMDTFSLLNRFNSDEGPKYPNTQHISSPKKQQPDNKLDQLQDKSRAPTIIKNEPENNMHIKQYPTDDDSLFNQVPKRFSQFIIDQQLPYMAQRLDNLSDGTASVNSGDVGYQESQTTNTRLRQLSSISVGKDLTDTNSNADGSQATIFSTRQEQSQEKRKSKSKSKLKFKRSDSTKSKQQLNDDQLYAALSNTSTLTRQNAIKRKEGGILYRIKLRLAKMMKRLNFLKFNNFKASTKRFGKSSSMKRQKTKTLKRKFRENPRNVSIRNIIDTNNRITSISAPLTNPNLGNGNEAERVQSLDDELKYLAGAPSENVFISNQPHQQDGKLSHLSAYIDEQQEQYIHELIPRAQTIQYQSNPLAEYSPPDDKIQLPEFHNEIDNELVRTKEETKADEPLSDSESVAPLPPPHLSTEQSLNYSKFQGMDVPNLWRNYLRNVISKRILLRQEISLYQSFMAENENHQQHNITDEAANTQRGSVSEVIQSEYGVYSSVKSSTISDIPSELQSIVSEDDVNTTEEEAFKNQYLNRRSILGEMLEYDSDSDSYQSSSTYSESTNTNQQPSVIDSIRSEVLVQRYGTQTKRTTKGAHNALDQRRIHTQPTMQPQLAIKRSSGFQHNLNDFSA